MERKNNNSKKEKEIGNGDLWERKHSRAWNDECYCYSDNILQIDLHSHVVSGSVWPFLHHLFNWLTIHFLLTLSPPAFLFKLPATANDFDVFHSNLMAYIIFFCMNIWICNTKLNIRAFTFKQNKFFYSSLKHFFFYQHLNIGRFHKNCIIFSKRWKKSQRMYRNCYDLKLTIIGVNAICQKSTLWKTLKNQAK